MKYLLVTLFTLINMIFANDCPSIDLQTNPKVNLDKYIDGSWYIQEQQINGYQSKNDLYCVVATYNIDNNSHVPLFSGTVISVYNYANTGKVNGLSTNNSTVLCGRQRNSSQPEKLSVAPCFLPNVLAGPYWIILTNDDNQNYEWAVISGGQPTVRISNETCTTKQTGVNGSGLWILSRKQILDQNTLMNIKQKMLNKGIAISELLPVEQRGCNYTGAFIK